MISSHVFKLVLGGLLILSLSLKVSEGVSHATQGRGEIVRMHIATFLSRHGFEPDRASKIQNLIAVSGRSGGCQLLIAEAAPQGWHRHILRRVASDGDQFFFLFQGRKFQDQPVWLTRLSNYWNHYLRNRDEPIFGIVGSSSCDLDALPWQELVENVATVRQ